MAIRNDIELQVIKAILRLMQNKPFYGHIVQQLSKIYVPKDHEIKTAAVGKCVNEKALKLYLNEDYISSLLKDTKLGKEYIVSIIEHEILHICFGHLFIDFADPVRGNVACDLCVNQYIKPVHPNWMTIERYEFPEGKSCYWYYENLKDNQKYQQDVQNGVFGENGLFSYMKDSHSKWKGAKEDSTSEDVLKDLIRKSKEACQDYGNIHQDIKDFLGEYLCFERPVVNWNRILRIFVAKSEETILNQTVMRISKRYGTRPGNRQEELLNVAVTVDTSGSINETDLIEFFREIMAIYRNGVKVTIIEADCKVCRTYLFRGKFLGEVHGRGGTNLEPALKYVDERCFDAHIYFTDFYAPAIEKRYKTPVLWVLTSDLSKDQYPYKWGMKVNIRDGRAI